MNKLLNEELESKLNELLSSKEVSEMKIEESEDNKFKVVVTTEWVDRDWEILKADGIDFKAYMKNPVVLVDHRYTIDSIVWKTVKIYQEGGKTIAEGIFADTENAKIVKQLYQGGFVKTVSIWFISKQRNENDRAVIEKSEMLEFSFVAVPANAEALSLDGKLYTKALESGIVKEVNQEEETKIDMKTVFDIVIELRDEVSEMKASLKTFTDDKVEEKELIKARKQAQELVKGVSAYLRDTK